MNNPIKVINDGPVLEVTIDRPKANAIDRETSIIMGKTFQDFRDNPDLRVAIIPGAGEKFFSAGWDLKAVSEGMEIDLISGLKKEQAAFSNLFNSSDACEGLSAFVEKRSPDFKGK